VTVTCDAGWLPVLATTRSTLMVELSGSTRVEPFVVIGDGFVDTEKMLSW
jgi:hypothetical protein